MHGVNVHGVNVHGVNAGGVGSLVLMSYHTLSRRRRSLAPLAAVTAAALIFAVLLVMVRLRWAPLEAADHDAATGINGLIAGNATLVAVVKAVTWLGSDGVLWKVVGAAAEVRRRSGGSGGWRSLPAGHRRGCAHPGHYSNRGPVGCGRWYTDAPASGTASSGHALSSSSATGRFCFRRSCPRPGPVAHRVHHGDVALKSPDRDQPDPARHCTTCPT
jgi:hypothetical protein